MARWGTRYRDRTRAVARTAACLALATAMITPFASTRAHEGWTNEHPTNNANGLSESAEDACLTFQELGERFPDSSPSDRQRAAAESRRAGCG